MQTEAAQLCRERCRQRCQQQAAATAKRRPAVLAARTVCACLVIAAAITITLKVQNANTAKLLPTFTTQTAYALETAPMLTMRLADPEPAAGDAAEANLDSGIQFVAIEDIVTAEPVGESVDNEKSGDNDGDNDGDNEETTLEAAPAALTENAEENTAQKRTITSTNPTPLADDVYETLCEVTDDVVTVPLMLGLIECESSFRENAVSSIGCYGLCQLNPSSFPRGLSPVENVEVGVRYLRGLYDDCGDIEAALTAYNAGRDTGSRTYANKVLAKAEKWAEILAKN